ncbi:MAG: hypothetical protein ACJA0N_002311 [Pseudohongiellaceae bacterium]|jgi:hypothetical protein
MQLAALIRSDWRKFSPNAPDQRIFYPKLHLEYAEKIARQWDAVEHNAGFVVRFEMPLGFIGRYELQTVGYDEHLEYKVPIYELDDFNQKIVGKVELVSAFTRDDNNIWMPRKGNECVGYH